MNELQDGSRSSRRRDARRMTRTIRRARLDRGSSAPDLSSSVAPHCAHGSALAVSGRNNKKKCILLGSFNCSSLSQKWKRQELAAWCEIRGIGLLAVQEHRIFVESSDRAIIENLDKGWYFVFRT
jgi:hypothetical protein